MRFLSYAANPRQSDCYLHGQQAACDFPRDTCCQSFNKLGTMFSSQTHQKINQENSKEINV